MAGVSEKKKYVAKVGLDFDGLKGKPRVEAGEKLPEGLKQSEIDELIKMGQAEEMK